MERKYLDLEGLERLVENSKDLFSNKKHTHITSDISGLNDILDSLIERQSYVGIINFPNVGKPGNIYIDTLANKSYRWDDTDLKYYCIGSDYNDINLIICGDSTDL